MTIKQIEYFLRLSKNLSFAKTAKELYTTQPTVTREIKPLENELGVELFFRNNRVVELTAEGEFLKKELQPIYLNLNNAIEKVKRGGIRQKEEIRIGYCNASSVPYLPDVIKAFHMKHPEVQVRLVSRDLGSLMSLYRSERLNILFGMKNSLKTGKTDCLEALYQGLLGVGVPQENALYAKEGICWEDLNGETILVQEQSEIPAVIVRMTEIARKKCPDSNFVYCRGMEEVEMMLLAGLGICIVPQYSLKPHDEYRHIPLQIEEVWDREELDYCMLRKKGAPDFVKAFGKMMKEMYL